MLKIFISICLIEFMFKKKGNDNNMVTKPSHVAKTKRFYICTLVPPSSLTFTTLLNYFGSQNQTLCHFIVG